VPDSKQMGSTIVKTTGGDDQRLVPDGQQMGVEALGQHQGAQGSQGTCKEHCTLLVNRRR
jgi:hypothetical protein